MGCPRSGVNILIWTQRKSVVMEQMIALWSAVKVHGLMVAGPSGLPVSQDGGVAKLVGTLWSKQFVHVRPLSGRPFKAPETQIYFTTHRSGANSVPSVRTVVAENGQVGRL